MVSAAGTLIVLVVAGLLTGLLRMRGESMHGLAATLEAEVRGSIPLVVSGVAAPS